MNFTKKIQPQNSSGKGIAPFRICNSDCWGGCVGGCDGGCYDGCHGACKTTCYGGSVRY